MSYELPKGWIKTTLGEIVEPSRERAAPGETAAWYVGLEHIEPDTMRLLGHGEGSEIRSSSLRFSKGDVLYGKMRPYLNKVWVAEFSGICSAEFLVFPKRDGVNNEFLAERLNAEDFVTFANGQVSGERPRVDFKKLSRFVILLPPAAEQNRIVSKLNAALSALARAQAAAGRARERLKRYRVAVLNAAVTGELTREWREAHRRSKRSKVESGRALLERLLENRRTRWETAELRRLGIGGKTPKNEKWRSRYSEPAPPKTDESTTLPKLWTWGSLDQCFQVERGRFSVRPRNDPAYYNGEHPFVQIGDLPRDGGPIRKYSHTLNDKGLAVSRKFPRGTILVAIVGATIGNSGVLTFDACCPDSLVAVQSDDTTFLGFADLWLRASKLTLRGAAIASGGQPNINLGILRPFAIPVPPAEEQSAIVREAEDRLLAAERLEGKLETQLANSRAVRRSLMTDAFLGKLVPQDPNDEPASDLLRRIQNEIAQPKARRSIQSGPTETRDKVMKTNNSKSPAARLSAAFDRTGKAANAAGLFAEAAFSPEDVISFYEELRANPEILKAFVAQSAARRKRIRPRKHRKLKSEHSTGRFRLVHLWLEDFKNLKNYIVRFGPTLGLDVVLGWNGTGKSNLFEALVIIFRDLHQWREKGSWPKRAMRGYRLSYEIGGQLVEVDWQPPNMKRPAIKAGAILKTTDVHTNLKAIKRESLPLPRFVFGYYSGPTNRLAEHFLPMKQAHYVRLRDAKSDDPETLSALLEQRRFFCAETHHAKYVLLSFCYREDAKISEFLRDRLRIIGFESALFVVRKPEWSRNNDPQDFWGATGVMRRVLKRLQQFAIAPMVLQQSVRTGFRPVNEDHYYFFLPDRASLQNFAAEYEDARTFFLALESTDFSELIHDVKVQVRVKATQSEEVPITFHEMSEGEQQLLMVLGLMRFTKSNQSLVLLDEPDTHLNPHWSVDYLKLLSRVMSDDGKESPEQQSSQILITTHDPLVIASLAKEQIHLLKRDPDLLNCFWEQPLESPRGMGYSGILMSDIFGFRSDLDSETLKLLDQQADLAAKEGPLSKSDRAKLEKINRKIDEFGFRSISSDPYYREFLEAMARNKATLRIMKKETQSRSDREAIRKGADEVLARLSEKHALDS